MSFSLRDGYPIERLLDRFVNLLEVGHPGGCVRYTGAHDWDGYGHITTQRNGMTLRVHRLAYEWLVGPIPRGLTIDHLCRVRDCVNPDHLEPVTRGENVLRGVGITAANARKTHCKRGHPLIGDNVGTTTKGGRLCRRCHADLQARKRARKKEQSSTL